MDRSLSGLASDILSHLWSEEKSAVTRTLQAIVGASDLSSQLKSAQEPNEATFSEYDMCFRSTQYRTQDVLGVLLVSALQQAVSTQETKRRNAVFRRWKTVLKSSLTVKTVRTRSAFTLFQSLNRMILKTESTVLHMFNEGKAASKYATLSAACVHVASVWKRLELKLTQIGFSSIGNPASRRALRLLTQVGNKIRRRNELRGLIQTRIYIEKRRVLYCSAAARLRISLRNILISHLKTPISTIAGYFQPGKFACILIQKRNKLKNIILSSLSESSDPTPQSISNLSVTPLVKRALEGASSDQSVYGSLLGTMNSKKIAVQLVYEYAESRVWKCLQRANKRLLRVSFRMIKSLRNAKFLAYLFAKKVYRVIHITDASRNRKAFWMWKRETVRTQLKEKKLAVGLENLAQVTLRCYLSTAVRTWKHQQQTHKTDQKRTQQRVVSVHTFVRVLQTHLIQCIAALKSHPLRFPNTRIDSGLGERWVALVGKVTIRNHISVLQLTIERVRKLHILSLSLNRALRTPLQRLEQHVLSNIQLSHKGNQFPITRKRWKEQFVSSISKVIIRVESDSFLHLGLCSLYSKSVFRFATKMIQIRHGKTMKQAHKFTRAKKAIEHMALNHALALKNAITRWRCARLVRKPDKLRNEDFYLQIAWKLGNAAKRSRFLAWKIMKMHKVMHMNCSYFEKAMEKTAGIQLHSMVSVAFAQLKKAMAYRLILEEHLKLTIPKATTRKCSSVVRRWKEHVMVQNEALRNLGSVTTNAHDYLLIGQAYSQIDMKNHSKTETIECLVNLLTRKRESQLRVSLQRIQEPKQSTEIASELIDSMKLGRTTTTLHKNSKNKIRSARNYFSNADISVKSNTIALKMMQRSVHGLALLRCEWALQRIAIVSAKDSNLVQVKWRENTELIEFSRPKELLYGMCRKLIAINLQNQRSAFTILSSIFDAVKINKRPEVNKLQVLQKLLLFNERKNSKKALLSSIGKWRLIGNISPVLNVLRPIRERLISKLALPCKVFMFGALTRYSISSKCLYQQGLILLRNTLTRRSRKETAKGFQ